MNASGAWGLTVAVPIRRESYEIERDAAGTAYAFTMDDGTEDRLTPLVQAELPGQGRADVHVTPGYIAVDATPDLRTPAKEYEGALPAAVRNYNAQHANHAGEELQIDTNNAYVGVYRPEDAQPLRCSWTASTWRTTTTGVDSSTPTPRYSPGSATTSATPWST